MYIIDEIISSKNEETKKDLPDQDGDILKLQDDDDIMGMEDFDSASMNASIMNFGHAKKENKSVMWRLKPENVIPERPKGMPPLMPMRTKKSLDEYTQMLKEDRIHTNTNPYGSRMSLNNSFSSNKPAHFKRSTQSLANLTQRNRKNDPIGHQPQENAMTAIKKLINKPLKFNTPGTSNGSYGIPVEQHSPWNMPEEIVNFIDVAKKGTNEYVDAIKANFGSKYNMSIQKEIAQIQQKPFMYTCGNVAPITIDGPGILDGAKFTPQGTNITLSCRFSQDS